MSEGSSVATSSVDTGSQQGNQQSIPQSSQTDNSNEEFSLTHDDLKQLESYESQKEQEAKKPKQQKPAKQQAAQSQPKQQQVSEPEEYEIEGYKFNKDQVLEFAKKHFNVNQEELKKSQQLAQKEAQLSNLFESLKSGKFEEAARGAGLDPVEAATQILENHLNQLNQPKEVTELEKIRAENQRLQDQINQGQMTEAEKRFEAETNFHAERAAHEFAEAIKKTGGFPEGDPNVIARMAQLGSIYGQSGRPYDANVLANEVKKSLIKEHQAMTRQMTDAQFEQFLTFDGLKRALKILSSKKSQLRQSNVQGDSNYSAPARSEQTQKQFFNSPQEFINSMRH